MREGRLGAGDCLWLADPTRLEMAVVMEPEVDRARCPAMALLAMVAFGDALGALAPPEVAVTYRWPNAIDVNGAEVGQVNLAMPPAGADWLVVGLGVTVASTDPVGSEPGENVERTTLAEEGCQDLSGEALTEAVARHWVSWLHEWSEEGLAPVAAQWLSRRDAKDRLAGFEGRFRGLDDEGNAIVERGGSAVLDLGEALL